MSTRRSSRSRSRSSSRAPSTSRGSKSSSSSHSRPRRRVKRSDASALRKYVLNKNHKIKILLKVELVKREHIAKGLPYDQSTLLAWIAEWLLDGHQKKEASDEATPPEAKSSISAPKTEEPRVCPVLSTSEVFVDAVLFFSTYKFSN